MRLIRQQNQREDLPIGLCMANDEEEYARPGFVPLKSVRLAGRVAGCLADLTIEQTYAFSINEETRPIAAIYRLPIPGGASVTGVQVTVGDEIIETLLQPREQAERAFARTIQAGKLSTLVTHEGPDVLTIRLSGLRPDTPIQIMTRLIYLARLGSGWWTLRVPATIAPRYSRPDEGKGGYTNAQPLSLAVDPGYTFGLELEIPASYRVRHSEQALSQREHQGCHCIFTPHPIRPDRDIVVSWSPPDREGKQPGLSVQWAQANDGAYFLAEVIPPTQPPEQVLGRELILLVDRSGSMGGPKWDAAVWASRGLLTRMKACDSFAIGLFNSKQEWLTGSQVLPATPETLQTVLTRLSMERAFGTTDLAAILEQALRFPRTQQVSTRHIVILTDAQVTGFGCILGMVEQESQHGKDRRRISVLCIDSSPNAYLAHEIAHRGGGTAYFVTSAPDADDITTCLDSILTEWDTPLAVGLRLDVADSRATVIGRPSRVLQGSLTVDLGDLPPSHPRWIVGRTEAPCQMVLRCGRNKITVADSVNLDGAAGAALRALFGGLRVLGLEIRSQNPDEKTAAAQQRYKQEIISESLRYGVLSNHTAFLVIRQIDHRPVGQIVIVSNAHPQGWPGRMRDLNKTYLSGARISPTQKIPTAPWFGIQATAMSHPEIIVWDGLVPIAGMLCDTETNDPFPDTTRFVGISARTEDGADLSQVELLLLIGQSDHPRARIRLKDLLAMGERPLNINRNQGERVRLLLVSPVWRPIRLQVTIKVDS